MTILVVEDNADILFAISALLESEGYKVRSAENGLVALALVDSHGVPDLILLDLMMPVMDGWHFLEAFRKKFKSKAPVVIMSAAAEAEHHARGLGVNGWIAKPFVFDEILPLIKTHLGR